MPVLSHLMSKGAFVYHKNNGTSVTYVVVGSATQALDGAYIVHVTRLKTHVISNFAYSLSKSNHL